MHLTSRVLMSVDARLWRRAAKRKERSFRIAMRRCGRRVASTETRPYLHGGKTIVIDYVNFLLGELQLGRMIEINDAWRACRQKPEQCDISLFRHITSTFRARLSRAKPRPFRETWKTWCARYAGTLNGTNSLDGRIAARGTSNTDWRHQRRTPQRGIKVEHAAAGKNARRSADMRASRAGRLGHTGTGAANTHTRVGVRDTQVRERQCRQPWKNVVATTRTNEARTDPTWRTPQRGNSLAQKSGWTAQGEERRPSEANPDGSLKEMKETSGGHGAVHCSTRTQTMVGMRGQGSALRYASTAKQGDIAADEGGKDGKVFPAQGFRLRVAG